MQITQEQYEKIAKYLPRQRGNVSMSNLQLINAILYVTENGCKWRALPETYGNWHTIYVRMNRWSKNGVLSRVFAALQTEGIIQINVEVVCLDSTTVKVHPDGTGALKKEENRQKKTASQSQITFKIIDAAIMNGFETLVRIGGYIMLFSILISLVEKLPLPKPVLILLENVLEITNGINCLANTDWSIQTKYILAMTATAFGGLSGIAQTSSMVKGTSLSMKKYCLVKLFLTLCTFLLAVAVSVFLF